MYGKCFVIHMLYVCVLGTPCSSSQCYIRHDLQFVNADRGCKRPPYGRGILQSPSHDCLIGSHACLILFTPSCCCKCFLSFVVACVLVLRCRGLCFVPVLCGCIWYVCCYVRKKALL